MTIFATDPFIGKWLRPRFFRYGGQFFPRPGSVKRLKRNRRRAGTQRAQRESLRGFSRTYSCFLLLLFSFSLQNNRVTVVVVVTAFYYRNGNYLRHNRYYIILRDRVRCGYCAVECGFYVWRKLHFARRSRRVCVKRYVQRFGGKKRGKTKKNTHKLRALTCIMYAAARRIETARYGDYHLIIHIYRDDQRAAVKRPEPPGERISMNARHSTGRGGGGEGTHEPLYIIYENI